MKPTALRASNTLRELESVNEIFCDSHQHLPMSIAPVWIKRVSVRYLSGGGGGKGGWGRRRGGGGGCREHVALDSCLTWQRVG